MAEVRRPGSSLLMEPGVDGFILQKFFDGKSMIMYRLVSESPFMTEIQEPESSLLMELNFDGFFVQKFFDEKRYDHLQDRERKSHYD